MFIDGDPPDATGAAMTVVCEAADGGGSGSVSYTHLTLPTTD